MKVLIVGHDGKLELGVLGLALEGIVDDLEFCGRSASELIPSAVSADLVVSLGSDWSVYSPTVSREIRQESLLLSRLNRLGVPVLGICFGAQMIAHTFGGRVSRSPKPEFGWTVVDDVAHEELAGSWMQWHVDRIEVPDSISVIGRNNAGIQAIRYGRCLGVQFHPEATYDVVSRWVSSGGQAELEANGVDPEEILETTRRNEADSSSRCRALFEWFLSDVAQTSLNSPAIQIHN